MIDSFARLAHRHEEYQALKNAGRRDLLEAAKNVVLAINDAAESHATGVDQ